MIKIVRLSSTWFLLNPILLFLCCIGGKNLLFVNFVRREYLVKTDSEPWTYRNGEKGIGVTEVLD